MSEPAARWSALHHGIDPRRVPVLAPWLRLMWAAARPLARLRVPPTALTVLGLLLALDAALLAGRFPAVAAALVALAALCDGLDGAVAVVADRATRTGAWADAVADRIADAAFAAVLWRCGAPGWLALVVGVLAVGLDAVRRLRGGAARAVVTVGERPTWTVCAVLAGVCAAVSSADWPATVCATVGVAAGVIAIGQLVRSAGPSS